jgi:hypothetical protein
MFDIQSVAPVTNPKPTYQQSKGKQPLSNISVLPDIELDQFTPGKDSHNGTYFEQQPKHTGTQTPKTPNELEMSCPPTPRQDEAVGLVQTWNNPPMNKWRILCCCIIYFGNGLNDAGTSVFAYAEHRQFMSWNVTISDWS